MPIISAIFLVVALVLAVIIGPQTRPWSWGPAMLALGIAVVAAVPVMWKRGKFQADLGLLALAAVTAGWFAWRAWVSPVAELGLADLLLLGGGAGAFVSVRALAGNLAAERILIWGIALLLLANIVVIGQQLLDPTFCPVFGSRVEAFPSGFYAHYNEAANYLIASALLVGAAALLGRQGGITSVCWGVIAIGGLAAVYFTRSRGGIFGAAVGAGLVAGGALIVAKRGGARWFAPALIAIPLIGLGIGLFLWSGWSHSQELRRAGAGLDQMLDNNCRLAFLGLAVSCVGLHPWLGGGSRSFSWECFRFWEQDVQGAGRLRPGMVHNELVQAATDYGLVGAGLVAGLLGAWLLAAILRMLFEPVSPVRDARDAWRVGALAGLAGMLVQSCFSFVFHLLPGIILLGICGGMLSRATEHESNWRTIGTRIALCLAAILCAMLLLPAGWVGTRVTNCLWPTHLSKQPTTSAESRIDALSDAIQLWPQADFYQERAALFQTIAGSNNGPAFKEPAERAIKDYQEAWNRHPYEPGATVNQANLLSQLQRDAEAEEWYARTIQLQGGMEMAFRGQFFCAMHYWRKGLRNFRLPDPEPAHAALELAANHIEKSVKQIGGVMDGMHAPRFSIHESLGRARESVGDNPGALASYNFAATLGGSTRVSYRSGLVLEKMAMDVWLQRRPREALTYFMEARQRILAAAELPPGATPAQRLEHLAQLDRTITFLLEAHIEPVRK